MPTAALVNHRFQILKAAGKGAFGTVYRAIDTTSGAAIALKLLDSETTDYARFEREAEVLATVRHPNVVSYVAHGLTDEGAPYLAMEWLEGVDLAERIGKEPLSIRDSLVVAARAAHGLAAVHALGIVHRDVKPSNLYLVGGHAENVRIIDLGLARVPEAYTKLTATGMLMGTPAYMAPEQARGARDLSPCADVFALGCVLFECLTGAPPFVEQNARAVLARLLTTTAPRVSERRPGAPAVLDALLARMLAPDAQDRFPDGSAVALAVSGVLSDGPHAQSWLLDGPVLTDRVAPARSGLLARTPERGPPEDVTLSTTLASAPVGAAFGPQGPSSEAGAVLVGRVRELAALEGTCAEVVGERCARVALVLGEAGSGKSRLLEEMLRRLASTAPRMTALRALGDRPTSTSPFAIIGQLVRHAASDEGGSPRALLRAEGLAERECDFLCELADLDLDEPDAPHLRAARLDPMLMADAFRSAWLSFIDGKLQVGPLLLAVEDLQLSDPASVRLIDAALEHAADRSLLVVATARPEEAAATLAVFEGRDPERIPLKPLRSNIAAELVRAIMPGAPSDAVDRVVARAGGNPLRLTEFARLGPADAPPRSALDAIETRLGRLDPFARRVLRAGSVFGVRFPLEGLFVLLGGEARRADMEAALRRADDERFVARAEGLWSGGDVVWAFRHGLVQEGAYATLDAAERRTAHVTVGRWLAERGADPSLIAWHFERGEERAQAFRWYESAARAALQGRDLERALALIDAAMACQPQSEDLGRVLLLRADAAFHRGDATEGQRAATQSMEFARPGSASWTASAGVLVTSAGQRGDNEDVLRLSDLVRAQVPEVDAAAQRVICLCRAATQLLSIGKHAAARALLRETERSEVDDPLPRAWVHRLRAGLLVLDHEYEAALATQSEAVRCHVAAGDVRGGCLARILRGSISVFAADFEGAAADLDVAEQMARRTGAEYFVRWAAYTRGKISALSGEPSAARAHLALVRRDLAGNPRIVAGAYVYGSLAALRAGDGAAAETDARAALEAHGAPATRAVALAALSLSLVLGDGGPAALDASEEASRVLSSVGMLEENEAVVHLAAIEAALACGREIQARQAAQVAIDRLGAIAAKLSTPARRESYMQGIHAHAQTLRLAVRLGLSFHQS